MTDEKSTKDGGQSKGCTIDQLERLVSCADPDLVPLVLLALYAGVRSSEQLSVRYHQEQGLIHVAGVKTAGSNRLIPAHPLLRRAFDDEFAGKGWRRIQSKLIPMLVRKNELRRAAEKANARVSRFATLRTQFLTWLAAAHPTEQQFLALSGMGDVSLSEREASEAEPLICRLPSINLELAEVWS